MTIKNQILVRLYLTFGIVLFVAILIVARIIYIQQVEGAHWQQMAAETSRSIVLNAERGNIYSNDGALLATSIPVFDVYFDPKAQGINQTLFDEHINTLSEKISEFTIAQYKDRSMHWTKEAVKRKLVNARNNNKRYVSLFSNLDYQDVSAIKEFPIFNRGKNSGGLIIEKSMQRTWPYKALAKRTIGEVRGDDITPVGLEGSFNIELSGLKGLQIQRKVGRNTWLPLNNSNNVDPVNGANIVTTVNVEFQRIAQTELLKGLQLHKADHGSAIVMEVATGKVKAIANLGLNKKGYYMEAYNYAVGEGTEPGSTFKAAALAALIESDKATLNDKVTVDYGKYSFCKAEMIDASSKFRGTISLAEAFAVSSNVGLAKTVVKHFGNKPENFIDYLQQFNLHQPTGINIKGEAKPQIIDTQNPQWNNCITLPWLSVGYSVKLSPLQILAFYNAIANNGTYNSPYLVQEINEAGKTVEAFEALINKKIMNESTAKKLQKALLGVIESGTAKNIKSNVVKLAGKTGTSKISAGKQGYQNQYRASFVGFFPANNPQYSCIVSISKPSVKAYYGSEVAAPVFKEIAEQIFINTNNSKTIITKTSSNKFENKNLKKGSVLDYQNISTAFNQNIVDQSKSNWTIPSFNGKNLQLKNIEISNTIVPDVTNMGLKDAIFLLEDKGLKVIFTGRGKVVNQSLEAGEIFKKGDIIRIELS